MNDTRDIWIGLAVLWVLVMAIMLVASSYDADHTRRITALEEHSRALTRAAALDAEVKDIHQKVHALEVQCGGQK